MPFANLLSRTFSVRSVETHAPAAPGIYGISNSRNWILIERSNDIRQSLLAHLCEQDPTASQLTPTGFSFELCDASMQASRQNRLVMEYEPVRNRLVCP